MCVKISLECPFHLLSTNSQFNLQDTDQTFPSLGRISVNAFMSSFCCCCCFLIIAHHIAEQLFCVCLTSDIQIMPGAGGGGRAGNEHGKSASTTGSDIL